MKIDGKAFQSIWLDDDGWSFNVIDQTQLPHRFSVMNIRTLEQSCDAIRNMVVRGAPLIGATAAYGLSVALYHDPSLQSLETACKSLLETRPTASNLQWALQKVKTAVIRLPDQQRWSEAVKTACDIATEDIETNRQIGLQGLAIIEQIASRKAPGESVNILTHCNAGWLATVDYGTATAPVYAAHDTGIRQKPQ